MRLRKLVLTTLIKISLALVFLTLQCITVATAKDLSFWLNHKAIIAIPEVVDLDKSKVILGKIRGLK